jgi:cbb3-type cytochrome oxidase maturation protein
MAVILILLIASILVAGGFLVAFLINARNGQFDDNFGPPLRMLYDDEPIQPK